MCVDFGVVGRAMYHTSALSLGHSILERSTECMTENVRTLVELRVSHVTDSAFTRDSSNLGFDVLYRGVPLLPSSIASQSSLHIAHEQRVLRRGTFATDRIAELRAEANVVELYRDSEVAPFHFQYRTSRCDDWLVDVGTASPIDCPIPPCDVEPTKARDCLPEVASFLGAD